jgi:3-(3-hydroxy-phenyl)propionate hydroxylase
MTEHAVVIAGGGPTGLMLAGELALAGVDVAIVERRASQDLAGLRAGGLHSRTIEVLDQRGTADLFLSQGQVAKVAGFAWIPLDISDFPTRHNYGLSDCGRTTSSASWPAGSASRGCRSTTAVR